MKNNSMKETKTPAVALEQTSFPHQWKLLFFRDIIMKAFSGGTPKATEPQFWNGHIPWSTTSPISENDISVTKAQRYISEEGLRNSSTKIIPKGNLLIGSRVGVGKCVVNELDIAINQDITAICLDLQKAYPYFLAYYFKTESIKFFIQNRKKGATIQGITRFDIDSIPIILPPLKEQKAISKFLHIIRDAIEIRKKELELQQELKEALMANLFKHGTKNESLKETEIGFIPQSWEIVKIKEIALVKGGKRIPKGLLFEKTKTPYAYIRVVDFHEGSIQLNDLKYISQSIYEQIKRYIVNGGDVCISIAGTVGQICIIPQELHGANLTENAAKFVPKVTCNNFFLAASLEYEETQEQIRRLTSKTSQPKLALSRIGILKIPFPPISEQEKISKILQSQSLKIKYLRKELSLYEELFQAMLEELMTGKISTAPLIENCEVAS